MTKAKIQEAVELALKVLDQTATEGEKVALQFFLALITKREERAYGRALTAAINEVNRLRLVAEAKAIYEARKARWASSP